MLGLAPGIMPRFHAPRLSDLTLRNLPVFAWNVTSQPARPPPPLPPPAPEDQVTDFRRTLPRPPPKAPHSEGNPGPAEIEGIVELGPALHAKELHEAFAGPVADRIPRARGAPRNPLQLGATFWHFRHESRVTSPSIWAQNLILPRYLRWPGSSASAPATTAGTAGPEQPAQATRNYPATDRRRCPRPGLPALRSPPIARGWAVPGRRCKSWRCRVAPPGTGLPARPGQLPEKRHEVPGMPRSARLRASCRKLRPG
jgi:hypothetical protein